MIRVLSLFTGIGAFEKALKNRNIPYDLVAFSEIDKHAVESYCAIHNTPNSKNLGDVCNIHGGDLTNINMITYGFPCTDIALCGKQQGLINADGNMTRSGLFFEALRIIDEVKPQFAVCENIAALAKTAKWSGEFKIVLDSLTEIGYRNYYAVLNAKDYGIAQHRERVFIVSVRDDVDHGFVFPKGNGESGCIADILEPEETVAEKHYLKPSRLEKLIWYNPPKEWNGIITNGSLETGHQRDRVYGISGVSATLTATDHKQPKQIDVRQIAKLDSHRDNPNQYRVYNPSGLSPTLTTMGGGGRQPHIPINGGVRRFTPLECFRLMGFDDEDYQKCVEAGVSDTQLYRQAGNSICVNVLEAIFDELSIQYPREFV